MKKSIIITLTLLFILFELLTNSNSVLSAVLFSLNIWKNNIFPSLFPFFVLSNILINYGLVEFLSEILKPLMVSFFKINPNTAFIFVMSMISGFPSSAKYTSELYNKGLINKEEASKVLTFSFFSNPLFILGTVSLIFLNSKKIGLIILLVHYLTNFIIGFIFRNYYISNIKKEKISFKKAIINMHNKRINNNKTFGEILSDSIINSINTLLLILGLIAVFLILTNIINNSLNLNNYYTSILNGILEMTGGLKSVSELDIALKQKAIIITMILSFGGISVHMQIISILSKLKIKYLPFLCARLLHSAIAGIIIYLIL